MKLRLRVRTTRRGVAIPRLATPHIAVAEAPHIRRPKPPNQLSMGLCITLSFNDLTAIMEIQGRPGMAGAKLALTAVAGRSHRIWPRVDPGTHFSARPMTGSLSHQIELGFVTTRNMHAAAHGFECADRTNSIECIQCVG